MIEGNIPFRKVICNNCKALRDNNLREECTECRSRKFPLLGYCYKFEARLAYTLFIIISVAIVVAVIAAFIYYLLSLNEITQCVH